MWGIWGGGSKYFLSGPKFPPRLEWPNMTNKAVWESPAEDSLLRVDLVRQCHRELRRPGYQLKKPSNIGRALAIQRIVVPGAPGEAPGG